LHETGTSLPSGREITQKHVWFSDQGGNVHI
jgi:hypothetical protein